MLSFVFMVSLIFLMSVSVFANEMKKVDNYKPEDRFYELVSFCEKVETFFPDISIINSIPYYNDYINKDISESELYGDIVDIKYYEYDGSKYSLYIFENGGIGLLSIVKRLSVPGSYGYDIVDGDTYVMTWQWWSGTLVYCKVDVTLNVYFKETTETYYFAPPNMVSDVFALWVRPVSLIRSGAASNIITFCGNTYLLDVDPLFGISLVAMLDYFTGSLQAVVADWSASPY